MIIGARLHYHPSYPKTGRRNLQEIRVCCRYVTLNLFLHGFGIIWNMLEPIFLQFKAVPSLQSLLTGERFGEPRKYFHGHRWTIGHPGDIPRFNWEFDTYAASENDALISHLAKDLDAWCSPARMRTAAAAVRMYIKEKRLTSVYTLIYIAAIQLLYSCYNIASILFMYFQSLSILSPMTPKVSGGIRWGLAFLHLLRSSISITPAIVSWPCQMVNNGGSLGLLNHEFSYWC